MYCFGVINGDVGSRVDATASLFEAGMFLGCGRYVQELAADCAWMLLSPALRGRLHALDSADDVAQLGGFASRFTVGQSVRCRVVQVPFAYLHLGLGGFCWV